MITQYPFGPSIVYGQPSGYAGNIVCSCHRCGHPCSMYHERSMSGYNPFGYTQERYNTYAQDISTIVQLRNAGITLPKIIEEDPRAYLAAVSMYRQMQLSGVARDPLQQSVHEALNPYIVYVPSERGVDLNAAQNTSSPDTPSET